MNLPSLPLLTSLSFAILALPAVRCAIPPPFVLVAHAPGTPLDGKPVNANGLAFWIGKSTQSYCPESVLPPGACPPGNQTVVAIGDNPDTPCSENAVCGSAGMVSRTLFFLLAFPSLSVTRHVTSHHVTFDQIKKTSKQSSTHTQSTLYRIFKNIPHKLTPSSNFFLLLKKKKQ